ncbi:MAG: CoA-binding protein, partial [Thermoproteota archaeon]
EGAALQERLKKAAARYGVRLMGPNCLGVIDTRSGIDTFFLPPERLPLPRRGRIALAGQSGALLSMWLEWLDEMGLGVSKVASYGNKVDVDEVDVVSYLADDSDTDIILLYLEGLRPGRSGELRDAVGRALRKGKPVVALKGGRTSEGARAAASHTGSLAAGYEIYRAFFRQAGIVEVDDMQELFDVAKAYTMLGPARGRRTLIVTNAGGEGVLAADYAARSGLELTPLSEDVKRALRSRLRPPAVVGNPVDLTASTTDEEYKVVLDEVLSRQSYDVVLVIAPPHPPGMSDRVADYIFEVRERYRVAVFAVVTGGKLARRLAASFEKNSIPAFATPERAAKAAAKLAEIGEVLRRFSASKQ